MKKKCSNSPSNLNHFDQIKKSLLIILVNSHAKALFLNHKWIYQRIKYLINWERGNRISWKIINHISLK